MAVFAKNTLTVRKVKDPGTDRKLPALKSLTYSAIDTPGALAEVTGLDCKLIHGDRQQWLDGDSKTTVEGNYRRIVDCNEYIEIDGHRNDTVYGDVIGNYYARTSCSYWGPVTLTYFAKLLVLNLDDDTTNSSATSWSNTPTDMGAVGFQFSVTGLSTCVAGVQIAIASALSFCFAPVNVFLFPLVMTVTAVAIDSKFVRDKFSFMESEEGWAVMGAHGEWIQASGVVNAGPSVSGITPVS